MNHEKLHHTLRQFLNEVQTLSLATVDDDGCAHASNLNFVADDELHLYWVSNPDSAHSLHIAERPRVAVTVYIPFSQPTEIRGMQAHGSVVPIAPDEFREIYRLFRTKFPYAISFEDRIREQQFYRFTPTWVRWIDNAINFGFKVESHWPMKI